MGGWPSKGRGAVDGASSWCPIRRPAVTIDGPGEADVEGQMTMPFSARDDYGVVAGEAVIALDLDAVDRRYGLAMDPEPREAIRVPLPMPISGSRAEFSEALVENFSQHPWANMPVTVSLTVEDAAAQSGRSDGYAMLLDARRFFDPLAAALIEMPPRSAVEPRQCRTCGPGPARRALAGRPVLPLRDAGTAPDAPGAQGGDHRALPPDDR